MKHKWIGPVKIDELLNQVVAKPSVMAPASDSVYLVSQKPWRDRPDASCEPLYVGSNTSATERFRVRVGDLIADMFGFYIKRKLGHFSGGKSLHKHCEDNHLNPKELYIGWSSSCECGLNEELELFNNLHPLLNKISPPLCKRHTH